MGTGHFDLPRQVHLMGTSRRLWLNRFCTSVSGHTYEIINHPVDHVKGQGEMYRQEITRLEKPFLARQVLCCGDEERNTF